MFKTIILHVSVHSQEYTVLWHSYMHEKWQQIVLYTVWKLHDRMQRTYVIVVYIFMISEVASLDDGIRFRKQRREPIGLYK